MKIWEILLIAALLIPTTIVMALVFLVVFVMAGIINIVKIPGLTLDMMIRVANKAKLRNAVANMLKGR